MPAAFNFQTATYNSRGIDPRYIRQDRGYDGGVLDWSGTWNSQYIDLVDRAATMITVTPDMVGGYKPSGGPTGTVKDTQVYGPFAYGHTTGPSGDASEHITLATPASGRNTLIRNASAWWENYYSTFSPSPKIATRAQFGQNPQAIAELDLHRFSIYTLVARYSTSTNPSQDSGTYTGSNGEIYLVCAPYYNEDGDVNSGAIPSWGAHGITDPLRMMFETGREGTPGPYVLDNDKWYCKPSNNLTYWNSQWTDAVVLQLFVDPACTMALIPISGQQMGQLNPNNRTYGANSAYAIHYHVPAKANFGQYFNAGDYTADNITEDDTNNPQAGTYRIRKVWLNWRGTKPYTYYDYNDSTIKCGARTIPSYLLVPSLSANQTNQMRVGPSLTPVVDGDGGSYTGVGFNGCLKYISIANPGHFDNNKPYLVKVVAKADVASTATPTYNTRLFNEWDSTELGTYWLYGDQDSLDQRVWPTHVRPMAMTWTVEIPSASTESQSLIRYRKTMGAYRFKYKLKYPPLTKEQFKPFLNHIMACKGGYREFYWLLNDGSLDVRPAKAPINTPPYQGSQDTNYVGDNYTVYTFQPTASGSSLVYLDGFVPQDDGQGYDGGGFPWIGFGDPPEVVTPYNVINKDQFLLSDAFKNNGDIAMSIVEQKANKFGEALVRVSHPTQQQLKAYQPVVLNPTKIRVVLDLNSIDFDINTVQLYGFDIGFIAIHPGDA